MKFTPEFIEKVQEANNLVDIISQYTVLKPAAGGYMGRCPFPDHQEKTPSFSVSESKQVYNCFGCHKKGNIFTFLQQYSGQNFPEAVEYLASRARIPLPVDEQEAGPQKQIRERKKAIYEVNRLAHQQFRYQLKRGPQFLREYLAQRGLDEAIIETFELGYASEAWDSLSLELEKKKTLGPFPMMPLAAEARLIKARKDDESYFDIFRDRLMFPIHLPSGEIVGFGGRVIQKGEPKYLNSPETPVFTKGKILYGMYQTAKFIRAEDNAIIVEGYMDLISLYQHGIKNVVASMGTAVTLDQAHVIGKLTKNVVALFDGDHAGQEAAERSLPLFFQAGLFPKGILLPDNQDPDDFLKAKGSKVFLELLHHAQDLFLLVFDRWLENFTGSPSEKVRVCDLARPILKVVSNPALKSLYYGEMARRLSVPDSWIKQTIENQGPQRAEIALRADPMPSEVSMIDESLIDLQKKVSIRGAPEAELQLVRLALKSRANFSSISEENPLEYITHPVLKRVLTRAHEVYGQDLDKFDKLPGLLINFIEEPEFLFSGDAAKVRSLRFIESEQSSMDVDSSKISERSSSFSDRHEGKSEEVNFGNESENSENKLIKDVLKKLKENHLKTQLRNLKEQLKTSPSEVSLQKLQDIHKQINQLKHGV